MANADHGGQPSVVPIGPDERVPDGLNRVAVCSRVSQVARDGRGR